MFMKVLFIAFAGFALCQAAKLGGHSKYDVSPPQSLYTHPEEDHHPYDYNSPPINHPVDYAPKPQYGKPMPFNFGYEVKDKYTGTEFSHKSDSDGHVTTGEYRVELPDGRTQIVRYHADHYGGYKAEVTYEGEARPYVPSPSKYESQNVYYQPKEQPTIYEPPKHKYDEPKSLYGIPH